MLFTCGLLQCQVELRVCLALQSMQTSVQVMDPDLGVRMHAAFSQVHGLGFKKVCAPLAAMLYAREQLRGPSQLDDASTCATESRGDVHTLRGEPFCSL